MGNHYYKPANICIYCSDASCPISDEHIIPFALGGKHILPSASCKMCARETGKVELSCCRKMLGKFRIQSNLPTRRKKQRPKKLPLYYIANDNQVIGQIVPVEEHPPSIVLPKFSTPTIFYGLRGVDTYVPNFWSVYSEDALIKVRNNYGGKGFHLGSIHPLLFGRMLAKIAHSHAIAIFGYDSFSPLLIDLILGNTNKMTDLVGGSLNIRAPAPYNYMIDLSVRPGPTSYLFAKIRLFAQLGTPIYQVVVGTVSPEFIAALNVSDL